MKTKNAKAREHFWATVGIETDGCLVWPYAKDQKGYGQSTLFEYGRSVKVHVAACRVGHGPKPVGMEVGHLCGNPSCYNHRHLKWVTRSENQLHRRKHGTSNAVIKRRTSRLSAAQRMLVVSALSEGALNQRQIADLAGCCFTTVSKASRRERMRREWRMLERGAA